MKKLLLTYFEPFGGISTNCSEVIGQKVRAPSGIELIKYRLPTCFSQGVSELLQKIQSTSPDGVLALGQAERRSKISLETVANNWADARIPDNRGEQPRSEVLVEHGPPVYFSTLPIQKMLKAGGESVQISHSAGSFVCNAALYFLLKELQGSEVQGGFIHLPLLSVLDLDLQMEALEAMIAVI